MPKKGLTWLCPPPLRSVITYRPTAGTVVIVLNIRGGPNGLILSLQPCRPHRPVHDHTTQEDIK